MGKQERRAYLRAIRVRLAWPEGRQKHHSGRILRGMRLSPQVCQRGKNGPRKPGSISLYDTPPIWLRHCAPSGWPPISYAVNGSRRHCRCVQGQFHPLSVDTLLRLDSILAATIDRLRKPIRAGAQGFIRHQGNKGSDGVMTQVKAIPGR